MPATKKLSDQEINDLMLEFAARRVRVPAFCAERGIAVPTFRRWKREWDEKRKNERLAALPEKPLAWMPPVDVEGYKEAPPSKDGVLTVMVDLADNLGPHTDQAQTLTRCCDGLVVSGKLIGALEYFAQMQDVILSGASELLPKYRNEAKTALEKLLPDTPSAYRNAARIGTKTTYPTNGVPLPSSSTWPKSQSTRQVQLSRRVSGAANSPPSPASGQIKAFI